MASSLRRLPRRALPGPDAPDPVEPLWEAVRELHIVLRSAMQSALESSGLLVSEYQTLRLCEAGPVPLKSITESLGVTPAATTDLARRLAQRKLLRLDPHPTDRRSRVASLTAGGRRVLRRAQQAKRTALGELGVGLSPAARESLLRGVAELRRAQADRSGDRGGA